THHHTILHRGLLAPRRAVGRRRYEYAGHGKVIAEARSIGAAAALARPGELSDGEGAWADLDRARRRCRARNPTLPADMWPAMASQRGRQWLQRADWHRRPKHKRAARTYRRRS